MNGPTAVRAAGRRWVGGARRWAGVGVAIALVAAGSGYLLSSPGTPELTTEAVFSDVGGLVDGAQVQLADVPVGQVTAISLDGSRARVTMAIDTSARVPADVSAAIDSTTILGEQFVDLEVRKGAHGGTLLADGSTITHTSVVPGVEQLVAAGTQVVGSISTGDLAQIIAAGGQGFTGQAASLRQLLNSLSAVTAGYAGRTADIRSVIDNLDQLGTTLAPASGADAQAVTNLSQTVSILAQQSQQFTTLLQSLNDLSTQGRSLLETYYPQITDQLTALAAVAGQLSSHQQDLIGLLQDLPVHDKTMSQDTVDNFLQVLDNLIVCGIPGGGADPSSAAATCGSDG